MPPDGEVWLRQLVESTETARMRDRAVHHSFDIDLDVLWSTIIVDLPVVLAALVPST